MKINSKDRIQSIDFFRGIAIISVVLGHFNNILPFFEEFGGLGVDLFFVISGFLVSSYPIKLLKTGKKVSYTDFILRRAFKIIPSYYVFLFIGWLFAIYLIKPISAEDVFTFRELPQYLLFFRNYGGPPPRWAFEHVWSLCVEEHFYILLPILFLMVQKRLLSYPHLLLFLVCVVILLGIFIKLIAYTFLFAEHQTYTHNRIDALALGVLLSLIIHQYEHKFRYLIGNFWLAVLGIFIFIILIVSKKFFSTELYEIFLLHTLAPIAFFLTILGSYFMKGKALKPFQLLAYYSYNIYLWHYLFVIPITYHFGEEWLGFSVFITSSLIAGIVFTKIIEEPFLKLREKVIRNRLPTATTIKTGWE